MHYLLYDKRLGVIYVRYKHLFPLLKWHPVKNALLCYYEITHFSVFYCWVLTRKRVLKVASKSVYLSVKKITPVFTV